MDLQTMQRKYAYTLARVGLNVQKGQPVLVEAAIEGAYFTPIFAEECYKLGAQRGLFGLFCFRQSGLFLFSCQFVDSFNLLWFHGCSFK